METNIYIRSCVTTLFILAVVTAPILVRAQQSGTYRTELQRYDLSAPGLEVIQVRVDFDPGVSFPSHNHPGEEIVFLIEGSLEYQIEGRPPVIVEAGEVLFIPYGANHTVKNIGSGKASELATYIVKKGEPLLSFKK